MASMAEMVTSVRLLIGDDGSPSLYSDSTIREYIILHGIERVNLELGTVYESDDGATISPEPTGANRYLMELAAAHAILLRQYMNAPGKAVSVKEGSSAIDLRGASSEGGRAARDVNALFNELKKRVLSNNIDGDIII